MSEDSNIRAPRTVTVGGTVYNALSLARMTDADVPAYGSAGEAWLIKVAEAYDDNRDALRGDYDSNEWQEAMDAARDGLSTAPGVSTPTTWQVVTDLKLFTRSEHFDYGLYAQQVDWPTGSWQTEKRFAVRIDRINDMLQWWLYEVASQLLYSLWQADLEANPVEDETSNEN